MDLAEEKDKVLNEISVLQNASAELKKTSGDDLAKRLIPTAFAYGEIDKNTKYILINVVTKMLEDMDKLLVYEISEKEKNLTV